MDLDSLQRLALEQYCYLTTRGRKSGKAHTVELWFALDAETRILYILSGGGTRSDWVNNLLTAPDVKVRVGQTTLPGRGRTVEGEAEKLRARELVVAKYYRRTYNPQGGWEAQSLPVAVDLGAIAD